MKFPDLPADPFVAIGIVELERISKLVGIEEKLRDKKKEKMGGTRQNKSAPTLC